MIIYPVTCALHKSKHQGMPMCVCVGWQKYTAAAGPHVWRPALHTPELNMEVHCDFETS